MIKLTTNFEKRISGDVNYDIFVKYLNTLPERKIKSLKVELIKIVKVWNRVFNGFILTTTGVLIAFILNLSIALPNYILNNFKIDNYSNYFVPTILMIITFMIVILSIYTFIAYSIACKEKKILIIDDYLTDGLSSNGNE